MNSFLASGGDNFTTLAEGTDRAELGKTDLEAFTAYLGLPENQRLAPDTELRYAPPAAAPAPVPTTAAPTAPAQTAPGRRAGAEQDPDAASVADGRGAAGVAGEHGGGRRALARGRRGARAGGWAAADGGPAPGVLTKRLVAPSVASRRVAARSGWS